MESAFFNGFQSELDKLAIAGKPMGQMVKGKFSRGMAAKSLKAAKKVHPASGRTMLAGMRGSEGARQAQGRFERYGPRGMKAQFKASGEAQRGQQAKEMVKSVGKPLAYFSR